MAIEHAVSDGVLHVYLAGNNMARSHHNLVHLRDDMRHMCAGKGVTASLASASHGAGRAMSRTAAREKYRWSHIKPLLEKAGVNLLSAGIDECPLAYMNIDVVMAQQCDLVDVLARFDPKIT